MSDPGGESDFRDLGRRWRESGRVEDLERYLHGRARWENLDLEAIGWSEGASLAKQGDPVAYAWARSQTDPGSRARALAYVARFTTGDPRPIALAAADAAAEMAEGYDRVMASVLPLAALTERDLLDDVRAEADRVIVALSSVEHISGVSEACFRLMQATWPIVDVRTRFIREQAAIATAHWRCRMNFRDMIRKLVPHDPELARELVSEVEDAKLRRKATRALEQPAGVVTFFH